MNLTEVKKTLEQQFARDLSQGSKHNVVFWYDDEGVFADAIDTLNSNCYVFVDNFMKNSQVKNDYNILASFVLDKLGLFNQDLNWTIDEITDCDTLVDKMVDKSKTGDEIAGVAGEFLMELMPYFNENEWLDTATLCKIANKPPTTVKRYLRKLVEKGMLEAQGANKNRQYRLLMVVPLELSTIQADD
jgi:hypothetical protein